MKKVWKNIYANAYFQMKHIGSELRTFFLTEWIYGVIMYVTWLGVFRDADTIEKVIREFVTAGVVCFYFIGIMFIHYIFSCDMPQIMYYLPVGERQRKQYKKTIRWERAGIIQIFNLATQFIVFFLKGESIKQIVIIFFLTSIWIGSTVFAKISIRDDSWIRNAQSLDMKWYQFVGYFMYLFLYSVAINAEGKTERWQIVIWTMGILYLLFVGIYEFYKNRKEEKRIREQ